MCIVFHKYALCVCVLRQCPQNFGNDGNDCNDIAQLTAPSIDTRHSIRHIYYVRYIKRVSEHPRTCITIHLCQGRLVQIRFPTWVIARLARIEERLAELNPRS